MRLKPENDFLYYSKSGSGPALIFLHGYMGSSKIWGSFVEELSRSFTCIAIDLPGHGKSEFRNASADIRLCAIEIKKIIEIENHEKANIIGHSLGGYIAMELAALHPESIRSLTLLHVNAIIDSDERKRRRLREIKLLEAGRKNLLIKNQLKYLFAPANRSAFKNKIESMENTALKIEPETLAGFLHAMMSRTDKTEIISRHDISVLLIFGRQDENFTWGKALSVIQSFKKPKTIILENSGHMGFLEKLPMVAKAVGEFITPKIEN